MVFKNRTAITLCEIIVIKFLDTSQPYQIIVLNSRLINHIFDQLHFLLIIIFDLFAGDVFDRFLVRLNSSVIVFIEVDYILDNDFVVRLGLFLYQIIVGQSWRVIDQIVFIVLFHELLINLGLLFIWDLFIQLVEIVINDRHEIYIIYDLYDFLVIHYIVPILFLK